jgi:hypothetical protein
MIKNDEIERRKGVYVTLETIGYDKKATEMLMVRKWLDQNLPGTQENRKMRNRRILFLARDKVTAQKAEMNSRRLYDLCENKVQRMDRINQAQGTIFSRNMITEKEENILEALKTYRCTKVKRMEAFRNGDNVGLTEYTSRFLRLKNFQITSSVVKNGTA